MALFTISEFIDLFVMVLGVGYIFTGLLPFPQKLHEIPSRTKEFLYSTLIAAPAVVFHEAAHKIAAISFGLAATFHASYFGLGLGIILKAMNLGIFFIPGYVTISGATQLQSALSAFAGPGLNLVLALGSMAVVRFYKGLSERARVGFLLSQKLNFFLFAFNMLPIPPFDGSKVFFGLYAVFFG